MTGATRLAKVLATRCMMSAVLCARATVDVVVGRCDLVRGGGLSGSAYVFVRQRLCDEAVAACALRARCCVVAGASLRQDSGHSEQLLRAALISMG